MEIVMGFVLVILLDYLKAIELVYLLVKVLVLLMDYLLEMWMADYLVI